MKHVSIQISSARSLEHAMDQAIEQAQNSCYVVGASGKGREAYRVEQVIFTRLAASCGYTEHDFTYTFTAELEELR